MPVRAPGIFGKMSFCLLPTSLFQTEDCSYKEIVSQLIIVINI